MRTILLRPLPFAEPERLVRFTEVDESGRSWWPTYPNFADWREHGSAIFSGVALADVPQPAPVLWGQEAARVKVGGMSRDFLTVSGVQPARGRAFTAEENTAGGPPAALVSGWFWRSALGARRLDDLTVTIGAETYAVVGVLPDDFRFVGDGFEWSDAAVWLPFERRAAFPGRRSHGFHVVGRLRDGLSLPAAQQRMAGLARRLRETHGEPTHAHTVRLSRLHEDVIGPVRRPVGVLFAAAVLVLLVACLNLAGTLLAEGISRGRELAVRAALGAGRRDLAFQIIAESSLLALPGAVLGVTLAWGAVRLLRGGGFTAVPRLDQLALDPTLLGLALVVAVAAALIAGLAPALLLGARDVAARLRASVATTPARGQQILWSGVVAGQAALTMALLFGTALLLRSFAAAVSVDLGYDPERVLVASVALPEARYPEEDRIQRHEQALERLRALPGALAVGVSNILPHITRTHTSSVSRPADPDSRSWAGYRAVDAGYFAALGIPSLGGEPPIADARRAWIDASLAEQLWEDAEPIGDRVWSNYAGVSLTVAGIVGSVREWQMDEPAVGVIYVDFRSRPDLAGELHYFVRTRGDPQALADAVRATIQALDPQAPLQVRPLEAELRETYAEQRLLLWIAGAFAVVALALSIVAIHAVVTFVVERRRREAGIRLALGARPGDVRAQMLKHALVPTGAGLGLGLAITWPVGRLVEAQLFSVSAADPLAICAAAATLAGSALLAAAWPARDAGRVDPVRVLREE